MKLLPVKPEASEFGYSLVQCAYTDRATGNECQTQGWKPSMYGPRSKHDKCEAHFDNSLLRRIEAEAEEINTNCRCGECGACINSDDTRS